MRYRRFGSTSLTVSEIGFGCARLGGFFQGEGRVKTVNLLRSALHNGISFYDTSDMYTQGESERLLGEAFRGDRDSVVIATKVGYVLPTQRRVAAVLKPVLRPAIRCAQLRRDRLPSAVRGRLSQDFSPAHLVSAVEQSLRRLRTDHVDVLQLHSPPADVLATGDVLEPLEVLRRGGKVRYYGVSCETTADALACLRYSQISCIQVRLSLLDRSAVTGVLPAAAARGLGIVARECFGGGLLARPPHAGDPPKGILGETLQTGTPGLRELERLAASHGAALPRIALHFALRQTGVSVVLVGIRDERQLAGNLAHHAALPPTGGASREVMPHPS